MVKKYAKERRPSPIGAASPNGAGIPAAKRGPVGFIGLGRMGTVMAANLAAAGYRVIAYLRHPNRIAELKAHGLEPTMRMADLFGCAVIVSMLPDDTAVRDVVLGREDLGIDG